jgi:hypothetical protein
VAEIKSYPELVDAVWAIVQGTPEEREHVDFMFSEEQVAKRLGVPWAWESDVCVFGTARAISDLVSLEYCKGIDTYNGHRWRWISPSPYCPDAPPSTLFITPPIVKLPPLRSRALQFIHEQTLRYENGITFYTQEMGMLHQEAVNILLPTTTEADLYIARGTVISAISDLKDNSFVNGSISSGYLSLWPTLKGASWLLVAQPLLKLEERASRLTAYPEVLEATRLLANAYSESQSSAAGSLYVAIEKLENASGGERGLIDLIGQSATYIKHLKHSLQPNRHAKPQGQTKLDHRQCLERATEIIEKYITLREQGSN